MYIRQRKPKYNHKIFNKIIELEGKYEPRRYFRYQRRGLRYSLPTSIKNTCRYIDRNIINIFGNGIYKNYGRIDFSAKQLYNLYASVFISLVTGVLVNVINIDLSSFLNQDVNIPTKMFLYLIASIFMLIPVALVAIITFLTISLLQRDYLNEYDLFIMPYERQKIVKELEKRLPYKGLF